MSNIELVEAELAAAKRKHPHFIDYFTFTNCATFEPELHSRRARLNVAEKQANMMFFDVLECEVYEALDAYAHGELGHAKQELAQCAAVCIRGMEFIETEMAKGGGAE